MAIVSLKNPVLIKLNKLDPERKYKNYIWRRIFYLL